jgi:hypothetical protein
VSLIEIRRFRRIIESEVRKEESISGGRGGGGGG